MFKAVSFEKIILQLIIESVGEIDLDFVSTIIQSHIIETNLSHSEQVIVLHISRLSEGSTGQIFATSSVIYQMKMWSL